MIAIIEKFHQGTASILEWLSHSPLVEMKKFFDKTFVSRKNWMIGIIEKCLQGTVFDIIYLQPERHFLSEYEPNPMNG